MRLVPAILLCIALPAFAQQDPREAMSAQVVESTSLDRLILANARAKASADPKAEEHLEYQLYQLRPPALWGPKHPAWRPARSALVELAAAESNTWVRDYWSTSALKVHVRELAYSYRAQDLAVVQEFAASPGGQAYFARRVAEARAASGEAMFSLDPQPPAALAKLAAEAKRQYEALPASEKQRVAAFTEAKACDGCGRSHAQVLELYIAAQSKWIAEVLVMHLGDIHYSIRDRWTAQLSGRFAAQLPVDSKKQLLGTLSMAGDGALAFRFTFFRDGRADGGALALDVPRASRHYAEVLALAPGLAPGQSRVLYRDRDGTINDKP